jgi:hypothetical protein
MIWKKSGSPSGLLFICYGFSWIIIVFVSSAESHHGRDTPVFFESDRVQRTVDGITFLMEVSMVPNSRLNMPIKPHYLTYVFVPDDNG